MGVRRIFGGIVLGIFYENVIIYFSDIKQKTINSVVEKFTDFGGYSHRQIFLSDRICRRYRLYDCGYKYCACTALYMCQNSCNKIEKNYAKIKYLQKAKKNITYNM